MDRIDVDTYRIGNQCWTRVHGQWYVRMFGWWPDSNGTPSHRWQSVPDERVPASLRARWSRDHEPT